MGLPTIRLPFRYNYIACFLTLRCNLKCAYCLNSFGGIKRFKCKNLTGEEWVEGLNRIRCSDNLPITLEGGEPSLHPDFLWIIDNIKNGLHIDILTNFYFDVDKFIAVMDPARLRRNAPYPSIRVSYHPQHMDLKILIAKILKMQRAGFSVGAFAIKHPGFKKEIIETEKQCHSLGIDFRTKEFLGVMNGKLYGTYRYRGAVLDKSRKRCLCRTSEFIIAPDGNIYRCHHDLYNNASALGNLLDRNLKIRDIFRGCTYFGHCNPCDVKIKTDRFQVYGHTSVEIKNIRVLP